MESHFRKFSFRTFPNGSGLGGHMRSHSLSLPVPAREGLWAGGAGERRHESASSAYSEEKTEQDRGGEEEAEVVMGLRFQNYGLRENPRRSIRVADPEFEEVDDEDGSASILVQDHVSEMESSRNLMRRQSKRVRKSYPPREQKLRSLSENGKLSWVKVGDSSEPASSISEETREEDVAFCLMLLSRDRWKNETAIIENHQDEKNFGEGDEAEGDDGTEKDESFEDTRESEDRAEVKSESRKRVNRDMRKYWCETCNKFFRSFQAFGGHRASHKKAKLGISTPLTERVAQQEESTTNNNVGGRCNNKVHECPYCDRVFTSGQALGGHKRSHACKSNYYTVTSRTMMARNGPIPARGMINLNMPALAEDELSWVEFGG